MNYVAYIVSAIIAYLFGCFNTSIVLSKCFRHEDIRNHGSGNAGATNVLRTYGAKSAIAVVVGDFLKGVLAVVVGGSIGKAWAGEDFRGICFLIAGFFVVLGHIYPVFFRFKGGKGVMTTGAVFCVLHPLSYLIAISVFILTVIITRYVSLGSILAGVTLIICTIFFLGTPATIVFAVATVSLAVAKHGSNIKKLLSGTENKFSVAKKK